tara:strand:+ start:2135 stop:2344 length:210 start_codon:yes stop_codon:yes gene_type:complete
MTLLSVMESVTNQSGDTFMVKLDYWTQFSVECHFRQLVEECRALNNTGSTENTEEDDETEKNHIPSPLN